MDGQTDVALPFLGVQHKDERSNKTKADGRDRESPSPFAKLSANTPCIYTSLCDHVRPSETSGPLRQ